MYGVKFEQKCLWGIVCFVESYLKKPTLLSDRGHLWKDTQRTLKEKDTSEKTSSFSGLSNKPFLSLTDFRKP